MVVGGKTVRLGLESNSYGQVSPANWADPAFDMLPGTPVNSRSIRPTNVSPGPSPANKAISHIANDPENRLRSITELGHIFDAGQWRLYEGTSFTEAVNAWKEIRDEMESSKLPKAERDTRYAGGYTLRIGRKEFSRFANGTKTTSNSNNPFFPRFSPLPPTPASDLLAIFTARDTGTPVPRRSTLGTINLNTAPFEVLRTLGAGITMEDPDPANATYSKPATIYGPVDNPNRRTEGDLFAEAVLNSRPFISLHQLSNTLTLPLTPGTDPEPFWGNSKHWPAADQPQEWRDSAAEAYFRQIYDLCAVRSRNFRVHIIVPGRGNRWTRPAPRHFHHP
ncbi:MAG: hypothetical protein HC901_00800 [Bdellovibrionaceae bacterium]|nr:hypothetical protein [Pseudobdellovibrionaceae bacterium]